MEVVAKRNTHSCSFFRLVLSFLSSSSFRLDRCSFFSSLFVRLGQVLVELLQSRQRSEKGERGERETEREKQQRESRYLILPSLAHPRQEINREGLAPSLLLPPVLFLSFFLALFPPRCPFFFALPFLFFQRSRGTVRSLETAPCLSLSRLFLPFFFLSFSPFPLITIGTNRETFKRFFYSIAVCLSLLSGTT